MSRSSSRGRWPTNILFWKMCVCLALVPRASKKNTWPKNHFGMPLIDVLRPGVVFGRKADESGPRGRCGIHRLGGPFWGPRCRYVYKCSICSVQCNVPCRTIGYAIALPGRKSGFRAGFRPDSSRGGLKISPPAGLRPTGGPISKLIRLKFRPKSSVFPQSEVL